MKNLEKMAAEILYYFAFVVWVMKLKEKYIQSRQWSLCEFHAKEEISERRTES